MRTHPLPLASLTMLLAACGPSSTAGGDAAPDAPVDSSTDGATDAGTGNDVIPGTDAAADAGFDAAPEDTGTPPADSGSTEDGGGDAGHPPVDAGDIFGDAGPLGEPAWVDVDVRTTTTCDALNACGGDVVGTWDVTGVCVEVPLGSFLDQCPGARVTYAGGHARGRVTFDGSFARRVAQSDAEVDLFVPSVCASFAGGCPGVESALRSQAPDSACTATASGDCNCVSRTSNVIDDSDGYSIVGNEIVSATLHKHWAYCITGDSFRYQDTSPSGPREPGIISLGRR